MSEIFEKALSDDMINYMKIKATYDPARLDGIDASIAQIGKPVLTPAAIARLQRGESIDIEIVGDSVTAGLHVSDTDTYSSRIAVALASSYPNATVIRYDGTYPSEDNPINTWTRNVIQTGTSRQVIVIRRNGVGGDTVMRAMRRRENYVGTISNAYNEPFRADLILICLGINDSLSTDPAKYAPSDLYRFGLITMVQEIRRRTNAEIVLMTPTWAGTTTNLLSYQASMKQAADSLGVGVIDLHQMFLDHYSGTGVSGQGDWHYDTYHPNATGHQAISDKIMSELFNRSLTNGVIYSPTSLIPYHLERVFIPHDNSAIVYSGSWITNHSVTESTSNSYVEHITNTTGAYAEFTFTGSDVWLISRRGSQSASSLMGTASLLIDGSSGGTLDFRMNYPTQLGTPTDWAAASYMNEAFLLASGLDPSVSHTVRISQSTYYTAVLGFAYLRRVNHA